MQCERALDEAVLPASRKTSSLSTTGPPPYQPAGKQNKQESPKKKNTTRNVSFYNRVKVRVITYYHREDQQERFVQDLKDDDNNKDALWYSQEELLELKTSYYGLMQSLDDCSSKFLHQHQEQQDYYQQDDDGMSLHEILERLRVVYSLPSIQNRKVRKQAIRKCIFAVLFEQERLWAEEREQCHDHALLSDRCQLGQDSTTDVILAGMSQTYSQMALQEAQVRGHLMMAHSILVADKEEAMIETFLFSGCSSDGGTRGKERFWSSVILGAREQRSRRKNQATTNKSPMTTLWPHLSMRQGGGGASRPSSTSTRGRTNEPSKRRNSLSNTTNLSAGTRTIIPIAALKSSSPMPRRRRREGRGRQQVEES